MKLLFNILVFSISVICLTGCKIEAEPIAYGNDVCQYCSMTIVDNQHASELVTEKGRIYKFDSVECMLNYDRDPENPGVALYLCNHYANPGELISAESATFLISEGIPSPMGAYLTAFDTEQNAMTAEEQHGGSLYNWNELREHWEDNYVYYE